MIVIDKVSLHHLSDKDGYALLNHLEYPNVIYSDEPPDWPNLCFRTEKVVPRRFFRRRGANEDVIMIGLSEQAQEALGIHYEAWDDIHDRLEQCRESYDRIRRSLWAVQDELKGIKNMPWWRKLKWVFVGG